MSRSFIPEYYIGFLLSRLNGQISEAEHRGVQRELDNKAQYIMDGAFSDEYQAPPLVELYYREAVTIYAKEPKQEDRIRLLLAMQRDLTGLLHAHIRERRRYAGNVVMEIAGSTGSGKSSCMLGLMEKHNDLRAHVEREGVLALRKRLSIDLQDLPHKLNGLQAGDAIAMDEQLHLVGEGAETALKTMRNLEDTLRGTMIDIYYASPGARDTHDASQGMLEAISTSPPVRRQGQPGLKRTRFLFSIGFNGRPAIPLGVVDLDWASPPVFEAYSIIKRENLERTKSGQFHSSGSANLEAIKKLFETPQVLERLHAKVRPTKADWKRYLKWYAPSMSLSEADMTASEIEDMLLVLRDDESRFPRIWGFAPTPNMRLVALGEEIATGAASAGDEEAVG